MWIKSRFWRPVFSCDALGWKCLFFPSILAVDHNNPQLRNLYWFWWSLGDLTSVERPREQGKSALGRQRPLIIVSAQGPLLRGRSTNSDRSALLECDRLTCECVPNPRAFSYIPASSVSQQLSYRLWRPHDDWAPLSAVAIRHSFLISDISVVPFPYSLLIVGVQCKCNFRNTLNLAEEQSHYRSTNSIRESWPL